MSLVKRLAEVPESSSDTSAIKISTLIVESTPDNAIEDRGIRESVPDPDPVEGMDHLEVILP